MTDGTQQLRDWMARRGFTQRQTARYLAIYESDFCQILKGKRGVDLRKAIRIEDVTGISHRAWVRRNVCEPAEPVAASGSKRRIRKA